MAGLFYALLPYAVASALVTGIGSVVLMRRLSTHQQKHNADPERTSYRQSTEPERSSGFPKV